MESQPQSPEFRNNPENFHPCDTDALRRSFIQSRSTVTRIQYSPFITHLVITQIWI